MSEPDLPTPTKASNSSVLNGSTTTVSPAAEAKVLRRVKSQLESIYKELIQVIFAENPDKAQSMGLERKVNMLIMSINDTVDELESRNNGSKATNLNEIEVKKPARAPSADMRSAVRNMFTPSKAASGLKQGIGSFATGIK